MLNLPEGGIVVFDKGFNRYFDEWTRLYRFFVTRLKDNTKYVVVSENNTDPFPDVLNDQMIKFSYKYKKVTRTVNLDLSPIATQYLVKPFNFLPI